MRIGLTIVLFLLLLTEGWAQWTNSGSNIYYNNGNVGIGTTTPSNIQGWDKVLDVSSPSCCTKIIATTSNATYRGGFFIHSTWHGGGGFVGTESNHNLFFITSYDPKMVLTTSGILGVGTTAPYNYSGLHLKSKYTNPWGFMAEASSNDRIIGMNHDGNNGVISVSYLANGGWSPLQLITKNIPRITIESEGNVGIGTTTPDSRLSVKGTIHSQEVKVDLNGSVAPDYVFEKDYPLTSLQELKTYIDQHKHLPEIPSAKEMEEEGIKLKEMNLLLLKKVEELTLHAINQEQKIETLQQQVKTLLEN